MLSLSLGLSRTSGQGGGATAEFFTVTPGADGDFFVGQTVACVLDMQSQFAPPSPGFPVTAVQIAVQGKVGKFYIGVQAGAGDAYDAASLTQVLFGGNAGVDPADPATNTPSDLTAFEWNGTDNLVFSIYMDSFNEKIRSSSGLPIDIYYRSGDHASTADKSSFSTFAEGLIAVQSMTVFG